jgi:hypothetical protein
VRRRADEECGSRQAIGLSLRSLGLAVGRHSKGREMLEGVRIDSGDISD